MKNIHKINNNIYITNDEEIKEGWSYDRMMKSIGKRNNVYSSKIIITTDQDLINDGVQAIDDEFLEWYVQNPSCEKVKIESWQTKGEWDLDYKIIIPSIGINSNDMDKKYTEEDMGKLWQYVVDGAKSILLGNEVTIGKFEDYINSLNKQD